MEKLVYKYLDYLTKVAILTMTKKWPNTFDDFFSNVGPNLDNEIPRPPPDKPLRNPEIYLKFRIPHNFLISATTQQEVNEIIIVCFFNLFIH